MSNKTTVGADLIQFEYDEELLKVIEGALGDLKSEAPTVLKNAVNATAKQAKVKLAKKAKETYVVKQTRFTKAMATKNATKANPTATINITSEQLELKDMKVSPASYNPTKRPSVTKAKVLLSSSLKGLEAGTKAFLVKFGNGHVTVAQRKTKARFPIKKLLSNSIPMMIGEDKVLPVVEPDIYDDLMENIYTQMKKVLK